MRLQTHKWLLLALLIVSSTTASLAQVARSLRINEVVSDNTSGIVDEYGVRSPWLEIYNTSAATVDIGGLYLTDDPNNPTKYPIRAGNLSTKLSPYQTFVIFLDGKADLGVRHSDFLLQRGEARVIYLFDSDGRFLVDSVELPELPEGKSYARKGETNGFEISDHPTPAEPNEYTHGNESIEKFKVNDPSGFVMTIIAMPVVFASLAILYGIFFVIGRYNTKRVKEKASQTTGKPIQEIEKTIDLPAEVYAAIAMALYEANRVLHDREETVITIANSPKRYSPWSSKIHTLRQVPELKKR